MKHNKTNITFKENLEKHFKYLKILSVVYGTLIGLLFVFLSKSLFLGLFLGITLGALGFDIIEYTIEKILNDKGVSLK